MEISSQTILYANIGYRETVVSVVRPSTSTSSIKIFRWMMALDAGIVDCELEKSIYIMCDFSICICLCVPF